MLRYWFVIVVILGLAMCSLTFAADGAAVNTGPIRIGEFNSYKTHPLFTEPYKKGWQLALDEVNAKGGVIGRPLVVESLDDGGTAKGAVEAVGKLRKGGAKLIFGGFLSDVGEVVAHQAGEDNFIYLSAFPASDALTDGPQFKTVFKVHPNAEFYGEILAKQAAALPIKHWATVVPDYVGGVAFANAFRVALSRLRPDVKWVADVKTALNKIDVDQTFTALKNAQAQGVFSHLFGTDLIQFVRAGKQSNYFDGVVMSNVSIGWPEYAPLLGKDLPEGWFTTGYPVGLVEGDSHKEFVEDYKKKYGDLPTYSSLTGYVALKFLVAAIERAGNEGTASIRNAMNGVVVQSPVGAVRMDAVSHQSTLGIWVGKTALVNDKPELFDFSYQSPEGQNGE